MVDAVIVSILVTTISTLILSAISKVKKSVCCHGQVEIDMNSDPTEAGTIKPVSSSGTTAITGSSISKV